MHKTSATRPQTSAPEPSQRRASALRRSPWSLAALIDQGFFLFAGAASLWLAWLVWREAWHSGGWWLIGLFVAAWAITAYLALPRLHRIVSSLYVPNYFIGRTRTADGLLGDPVNLALRGSEAQLHRAMQAAGWTMADEITARSAWRMALTTLLGRSYITAPVSSLFLFGRRQDFAYQQEVNGSPGKRHHVRFWRCPQGWLLPGGHQVDWLAAGTYDKSVGLSLFTLQITHKIDENTDIERDYIVQTVTTAMPAVTVTNLEDFSTGYHSRNGGGDTIQTDGDLPILELGAVRVRHTQMTERSELILDATDYETTPEAHDTLLWQLWSQRPPQVSFGVLMLVGATLSVVLSTVVELLAFNELHSGLTANLVADGLSVAGASVGAHWILWGAVGLTAVWVLAMWWLAHLAMRGSDRARLMVMAGASVTAVVTSLSVTIGKMTWAGAATLSFIGLNIAIIVLLSSDAARRFTRSKTASQRR